MAEMTLVDAAPLTTAVVRGRVTRQELPRFLGKAFTSVAEAVDRQGTHVTGPPVTVYRPAGGDELDVEAGFPVAHEVVADGAVAPGRLPGGRTVETFHTGPYATLPGTYAEIETWIRAHGLSPAPFMWEVYLTEPEGSAPSTLVVQPVEEAPSS